MELVIHLDDFSGVNKKGSLNEFVSSLESQKLKKGTFFSGTIYLNDLPGNLRQAEVQGVIGEIIGDLLLDMTLTSVSVPNRWTCTYRSRQTPKWVERK